MSNRATIAACAVLPAALFGCVSLRPVDRRGDDLIPQEPAPGRPEAFVPPSSEGGGLAARLASELAGAGVLVHLRAPGGASLARSEVITLGNAADREVIGAAGRVAIAPGEPVFAKDSMQPLLLIRPPGPPPLEQSARPVWELRFEGLRSGFHLSVEEEHTLIEAVILWVRNRALD